MRRENAVENFYNSRKPGWAIHSIGVALVTIIIFVVLFSKIDLSHTISVLTQIDPKFLIIAIILSIVSNIIIPTEEWRCILKALGCKISYKDALLMKLGNAPIKNITPFKSGEMIRVFCLKKMCNVPFSLGMLSVFMSVVFGLFAICLIAFFGCIVFAKNPYGIGYMSFLSVVLITFLHILFRKDREGMILCSLKRWSEKLYGALKSFKELYVSVQIWKLVLPFLYVVIVKVSEVLVFFVIFKGLGAQLPISSLFIFVPIVMIVSFVPIAILGLGVREGVILMLFNGDASGEILLSGGILFSVIDYVLPAVIGLFFTRGLLAKVLAKNASEDPSKEA